MEHIYQLIYSRCWVQYINIIISYLLVADVRSHDKLEKLKSSDVLLTPYKQLPESDIKYDSSVVTIFRSPNLPQAPLYSFDYYHRYFEWFKIFLIINENLKLFPAPNSAYIRL